MYNRGGHQSKKSKGSISEDKQKGILTIDGQHEKKSNCFSVRLPANIHEFLRELSEEKGISASEVLRVVLSNRLADYMGTVRFVDKSHSRALIDELAGIGNELHKIRVELNRIGVNYHRHLAALKNNTEVKRLQSKLQDDRNDLEALRNYSEKRSGLASKISKAEAGIAKTKKEIAALEAKNKKAESENAVRLEQIAPVLEEFKQMTLERGKKLTEIIKDCY